MHFLFQLWTVQRTASHVRENWYLQIDPYAFESLSLCFVYSHGKACDQRRAVMRSTASYQQCRWLRPVIPHHLPLCGVRRCPRSMTSYRKYVTEWPWIR
jgi:hypothetical protein